MIWSSPRMRDDDGRKLDHKTLEQLRLRAVRQIEQGAHPEDVAAGLGMTRAAVYGWLAKYREGGLEALKARPVPGRPSTLSGAQLQRIYTLVVGNDPRQLQFAFALWTRAMVRELIGREFGVRLSEVSVGRLLRKLGLSPQRPLYRAYQQNPEVVASTGDRFAVNLISAVTAKGKLRFGVYDGNLNGKVFIDFCRRLLHDSPG